MVEHLKVLISRAPKGDGGLNSRACYRILSLSVEHLKVLMVEHLKVLMVEPLTIGIVSDP